MTSRAYGARSPSSHYNVILIVTSFATELATPTVTDVRTDTLPRLIYKDALAGGGLSQARSNPRSKGPTVGVGS